VSLYDNLKFDLIQDIVPVASIYRGFCVLVVQPSFPAKTLPEFIAYVKSNPGKLHMASGGVGTPQHLFGELFMEMTGVSAQNDANDPKATSAPRIFCIAT